MTELISKLIETEAKTVQFFDLPESELNKTYGEGKWSVRYVLHHIADAETVLYERVRRIISNPNQVIWGFHPDAWAKELNYDEFPLELNKNIYLNTRKVVIYLAEKYYESHGENSFVHNETGLRRLKDEFDKIAWHNESHLKQIEKALEIS